MLLLVAIDDGLGQQATVTLQWKLLFDQQPLVLDSVSYTDAFGEPLTLTQCKYYVSHFKLFSPSGSVQESEGLIQLVNAADTTSFTLSLPTKPDSLVALSFVVGVDSILNISGAQEGALDPLKGMFWTWNSGYVMAKLEGHSPVSTGRAHLFEYHIGGFHGPDAALRTIELKLPGQPIFLKEGQTVVLEIHANISHWFNGVHVLKIAEHAACATPGPLARLYADNYAKMFTLTSVKAD